MASSTERLERLVADELGDCCDADLDDRLAELRGLADDADAGTTAADSRVLSALGSDTRYTIVRLLHVSDGDRCVCEIAPLVDVSESAVSHALSELTDAGLLTRRKDGKWRYYGTTARADALVEALDETRGPGVDAEPEGADE
ncbi:ArsR/SmtB family transcription factor [Halobaculum sp. D14]|uniref:ArsR/SmtB family transcription factor n=1 Tax=Halobaculum sp. D14 TaxID=3421642 RepID=UPI003EBCB65F